MSKPSAPARVLTIADVAARLNVGRATVYRLIANGALRVVNVAVTGTRMRVREDDLSAFIEQRTVDAADLPDTDDLLAAGS